MQVNESINSANLMLVSSQTQNSNTTRKNNQSSTDFSSYLSDFASKQDDSNTVKKLEDSKTVSTSKDKGSETSMIDESKSTSDSSKPDSSKQTDNVQDADDKQIKPVKDESKTTTEIEDAQEVTQGEQETIEEIVPSVEELESVLELVGNVMQILMNQLGLSMEDISDKLESFGMESTDLLSSEGMKEFFLNVQNAQPSDLLVNENLQGQLQEVLSQLEDVLAKADFSVEDNVTLLENPEVKEVIDTFTKAYSNALQESKFSEWENIPEHYQSSSEETEVIVTNNKENVDANNQKQDDSATKEKAMMKSELLGDKSETQTTTSDFQNPILQAINEALGNRIENVMPQEAVTNPREIINQVVEQIKVNMNQDNTSMQMQLYPEHLGKIQINVVSKDGIMTAKIVAETEAAKQAIEGGLASLKENFEQQNLKVDAIEVMVSTTGFERNEENSNASQDNSKTKGNKKIDLSELEEDLSEEQNAEVEKMKATGSSVSYSA